MESAQTGRELEELLQEIEDDVYSIRLFNERVEKEISVLRHEESMLADFILKRRCAECSSSSNKPIS